jgi:hypothetical protein
MRLTHRPEAKHSSFSSPQTWPFPSVFQPKISLKIHLFKFKLPVTGFPLGKPH